MRKLMTAALAATGGLAMSLLSVAPAWAVAPPTTVSPAGDYISLGLAKNAGGWNIVEQSTGVGATCTGAASKPKLPLGTTTKNQIPTTGNPTASGPVVIPIARPRISNCTTSIPNLNATVTTSGPWKLAIQHRNTGNTASIRVPAGGAVVQTSGLVACTFTVSAVSLTGQWVNGSPSRILVNAATVPLVGSGPPPCLNGAGTGLVGFTYVVRDVSDTATAVTVS